MAWVEAWMRGCMLIVSGRGQALVLDEPERHLAGVNRRDDGAAIHVRLHARAWCQCYRVSVRAGGAAARACLCGI